MHCYQHFALGALAFLLTACGQPAQAPAPADDTQAAGAVEIPMSYQPMPNPHARGVWFVCDVLMSPTIYVAMAPDESGAFQLIEYERGNATPVSTKTNRLYATEQVDDAYRLAFHQDDADGLIIMSNVVTDGWSIPVSNYGTDMNAGTCRLYPRTYVIGFTEKRSFVIRDPGNGNDEVEYLGFDASAWQDARLVEQPDGTRTTTESVRAVGRLAAQGGDTLQWEFTAGSSYLYRVSARDNEQPKLEVLRDGHVISSEPIIAWELGARR